MSRIGIDVGGTNTDAVLVADGKVVAAVKTATTEDVSGGVKQALADLLRTAALMPAAREVGRADRYQPRSCSHPASSNRPTWAAVSNTPLACPGCTCLAVRSSYFLSSRCQPFLGFPEDASPASVP
jgi:hypothetical protein